MNIFMYQILLFQKYIVTLSIWAGADPEIFQGRGGGARKQGWVWVNDNYWKTSLSIVYSHKKPV